MRPLVKIVPWAGLLLVLVLGVGWTLGVAAPGLGRALERQAARSGVELEVDAARFSLRRGLELGGVRGRVEADGDVVTFTCERLLLEHRLGPLLRGDVVVDLLRVEGPRIGIRSARPDLGPGEVASPAGEEGGVEEGAGESDVGERDAREERRSALRLEIAEVRIVDGSLESVADGSGGTISIERLDLTLREVATDPAAASLLVGLSGRGWIDLAGLAIDDLELQGAESGFGAEHGRYRVDGFEAESVAGRLWVEEIEVDLGQSPYRYRLAMQADELDLERLLGLPPSLGHAGLELRATGEGPGLQGAVAEMSLTLGSGTLPPVTLFERIDRLAGTSFDGASYEPVTIEVSAAEGRLEIDPFEFETPFARLEIGGRLGLDDRIDLRVAVRVRRPDFRSGGLSGELLDRLSDRAGWVTLPLRIGGTLENPRFGPDMAYVEQVGRFLDRQALESLRRRFRGEISGAIRRRLDQG